ncbi:hypothetical protein AKG94_09520 [Vibrio harveyi]|nr:hypothetical protein AKG94_09520 [Vibrio harveyi]
MQNAIKAGNGDQLVSFANVLMPHFEKWWNVQIHHSVSNKIKYAEDPVQANDLPFSIKPN